MNFNIDENNQCPKKSPTQNSLLFSIETYSMLSILKKMKETLGLETMLEYLDVYLRNIDQNNPKLKMAVEEALKRFNVAKIYEEARTWEQKREFLP